MNATESPQRLRVQAAGLPQMRSDRSEDVQLGPAEARWIVVAVRVPPEVAAQAGAGSHPIRFDVSSVPGPDAEAPSRVLEKSTFMVPR